MFEKFGGQQSQRNRCVLFGLKFRRRIVITLVVLGYDTNTSCYESSQAGDCSPRSFVVGVDLNMSGERVWLYFGRGRVDNVCWRKSLYLLFRLWSMSKLGGRLKLLLHCRGIQLVDIVVSPKRFAVKMKSVIELSCLLSFDCSGVHAQSRATLSVPHREGNGLFWRRRDATIGRGAGACWAGW